jgi:hypothetical protein
MLLATMRSKQNSQNQSLIIIWILKLLYWEVNNILLAHFHSLFWWFKLWENAVLAYLSLPIKILWETNTNKFMQPAHYHLIDWGVLILANCATFSPWELNYLASCLPYMADIWAFHRDKLLLIFYVANQKLHQLHCSFFLTFPART